MATMVQTPEAESVTSQRLTNFFGAVLGVLLVSVLVVGACIALPYILILHWVKQHRELSLGRCGCDRSGG